MPERTLPIVTISPNPPVFDLPVLVAQAEGLFAQAGIEVRFSAPYEESLSFLRSAVIVDVSDMSRPLHSE